MNRGGWNKGIGKKADPRECPGCRIVFVPKYKKRAQRFCSKSCAGKILIVDRIPMMTSPEARAKNRASQVGRGKGKGYLKFYGRHEHRVIAERMLGRSLMRGEVVHHKDGNHRNNDPSNLEVITQGEHMRKHGLGIPGKPLTWEPWKARKRSDNVDHIQACS